MEPRDREHWRRAQKTRRWGAAVAGLVIAALAFNVAAKAFIVARLALSSPELSAAVMDALYLTWHGVSPSQVYTGYQIWIRDLLGNAVLSTFLLIAVTVGALLTRREVQREARIWAHIDRLENEIRMITEAERPGLPEAPNPVESGEPR